MIYEESETIDAFGCPSKFSQSQLIIYTFNYEGTGM